MKRVLAAMTTALLAISLVAGAAMAGGGNSANAKLCQKGGYRTFIGAVGPFATQGACVRYAAMGRSLRVPIGIVLPSAWVAHKGWLDNSLKAARYGASILFSQDSATEKAAVETLIRRGIQVLILTPQDGTAAAAAAREARAAHVKVIAYDRLVLNTRSVDYYVTFDLKGVGAAQAQYLIAKAGDTKGNSLYLYAGDPADNNSFLFFEGAWETLQPKIADGTFVIMNSDEAVALQAIATLTHQQQEAVIGQVTTNWSYGVAYDLANRDLGPAHPAVGTAFILAPNDETARAIADAIEPPASLAATSYVTGQDADQVWVQRLIDGTQGMTVFKDPRTLASNTVAAAAAFLRVRTPAATTTFNNGAKDVPSKASAIVTVTVANIQAALIDTGFYQASDFTGTWPDNP